MVVAATAKLSPAALRARAAASLDAVHLASALVLRGEGLEVTFACSDRNLLKAAAAEGLIPFDPAADV